MKRLSRTVPGMGGLARWSALTLLLAAAGAAAQEKALTVGVYLPTSLSDGKTRLELAEGIASALASSLERPVEGKSYGRFEDLARAVQAKQVDVAVVDAWAAAQLPGKPQTLSRAAFTTGADSRWAVVSPGDASVTALKGQALAVVRAGGKLDPRFLTHAIFGGDLDAARHFKLVWVPNVESAVRMVEANGARGMLIPEHHVPAGAKVVFRSGPMAGAVVLGITPAGARARQAVSGLKAIGPLKAMQPARGDEVAELRERIVKGAPARLPVLVEARPVTFQLEPVIDLEKTRVAFPTMVDALEVSEDQPDE